MQLVHLLSLVTVAFERHRVDKQGREISAQHLESFVLLLLGSSQLVLGRSRRSRRRGDWWRHGDHWTGTRQNFGALGQKRGRSTEIAWHRVIILGGPSCICRLDGIKTLWYPVFFDGGRVFVVFRQIVERYGGHLGRHADLAASGHGAANW